jgi:hypothetical protein
MASIEHSRERKLPVLLDDRSIVCTLLRATLQLLISGVREACLATPFRSQCGGFAACPRAPIISISEDESDFHVVGEEIFDIWQSILANYFQYLACGTE